MKNRRNRRKIKTILMISYFAALPVVVLTICLCIYICYASEADYEDAASNYSAELPVIIIADADKQDTDSKAPKVQQDSYENLDDYAAEITVEEENIMESTYSLGEYHGVSASKQAALEKQLDELMELTEN